MKHWIHILALFFVSSLHGVFALEDSLFDTRWIQAQSGCMPIAVPDDFGITHFIVGFPHDQLKTTQKAKKKTSASTADAGDKQALFSPDDDLEAAIIDLINHEQDSIKIAIFTFTNKDIAQALLDAHKRGVKIEIVADPSQFKDRYSKISMLQDEGIYVFEYDPNYVDDMRSNLMHHKFAQFGKNKSDRPCVWTGSYNFTKAAGNRNQENAVIVWEPYIAEKFQGQFERLKQRCVHCKKNKSSYKTAQSGVRTKRLKPDAFMCDATAQMPKNMRMKKVKVA